MRMLMVTAHATLLDGVNRHIQALAPALNSLRDVELKVCVCKAQGELTAVLQDQNVETVHLNLKSLRDLLGVFRFARFLLEYRPEIVHVEMPILLVNFSVFLVRLFGVRVRLVETIHGVGDLRTRLSVLDLTRKKNIRERCHEFAKSHLDGVIYISKGVRDVLPRRSCVEAMIYNPMKFGDEDLALCCNIREIIGCARDVPVIGTACRIAAVKRPDCFVRVMLKVLTSMPTAHAVVLGDGDSALMDRMRGLVRVSGFERRFHLLGYRSDAKQLIDSFSCFVMTSYSEGMPTALLEAISQKVPVAFWAGAGGLADLAELNAKEGPIAIVREQDDETGLASGIVAALKSPETLRGNAERAFEVCRKIFDVESIAHETLAFYRKVCSK